MSSSNSRKTESQKLDEIQRRKRLEGKSSRKLSLQKVLIPLLLVLGLIAAISLSYYAGKSSSKLMTGSDVSSSEQRKVQDTVSGKSKDQDKKDALHVAESILNSSATEKGKSTEDRLKSIDSGDESSVPKDLKDKITFVDSFESDPVLQRATYESIITLKDNVFKDKEAKAPENGWQAVEVDSSKGIAWVPVGAISQTGVPFTFEMVYKDGEWKLSPYSLLESVKMSSMLGSASETSK